jgi:hypothetical protein
MSDNLSWSHIGELLKVDDELERSFYELYLPDKEALRQIVSRTLEREKIQKTEKEANLE